MSAELFVAAGIEVLDTAAILAAEVQELEIAAVVVAQEQSSSVVKYSDKQPFPEGSADNFEY